MKKNIIIIFALVCSIRSMAQPDNEKAIRSILDQQITSWNKGDLETFMQGYWNNDSLMFVGKSGVTYGFENTLERYRRSYPDKAAMGSLSFDILHVTKVSEDHFFVVGKYTLERTNDKPQGHYTLLFRKINGVWKIVCDHSS